MASSPTAQSHVGIWDNSIPNQSPKLVIVSIVFFVVTTLSVTVRFAWRWAHRQHGWDDVMALCAYIILLIMTVFLFIAAAYGFGKPMRYILPTLKYTLKYFYLYQIGYKLLGGFTKLTFCFLYLRIFPQGWFKRLVIAITCITAAGSLAFTLGTIFQCTPISGAWDKSVPNLRCTDNTSFWYSHAAFNTFLDIVIFILPIPMIRTLKLARGSKTGLISIFSLGAFVIAASIARMVALRDSAITTDPTYGSLNALMWTEIEGNTSVICCCLPALRVPMVTLWNHIFAHTYLRTASTTGGEKGLPKERPSRFDDGTWAGPHRSTAHASASMPPMPSTCYHSSSSKSKNNTSSSGRASCSETWYERALRNMSGEGTTEPDEPTSSSLENLAKTRDEEEGEVRSNNGMPQSMPLNAIYKTTDLHVSTTDLEARPKRREDRNLSLADFLKDG